MEFVLSLKQFVWPALATFTGALILMLIALRVFPLLGLMDRPAKYGLKRDPIPYYGGLVLIIGFVVFAILFVPMTKMLMGFLLAAILIFLLGFLDDLLSLSPVIRLVVQAFAAMMLVYFGIGIFSINLPFIGIVNFSEPVFYGVMVLSAAFTVFWVMTLLNTMNFVDGIGGLSSGVSFVAGITLFFLSVHPSIHENPETQFPVAMLALILAMVSLAFLIFDFPRPRILMGDSGSTLLGFIIATLAIFSGGKVATAFLVLGLPILDMIWVVMRRVLSGKKFWQGDLLHLHHRLLDFKLSEAQVVSLYLSITALLGLLSVLFVSGAQKIFMVFALILLLVVFGVVAYLFKQKKR